MEGIDQSAQEVRLEDLEKKGIRRVRVLRPADIERMIQDVLAEALLANAAADAELVRKTRDAVVERVKAAQAQMAAAERAEAEIDRLKAANAHLTAEVRLMRERLAHAQANVQNLEEKLRVLRVEAAA
jgi:hypothetical protein